MNNILQLAAQGDAKNLLRDIRVRALYSPYYFVKVVLGYSKLVDHFHQKEMERFVDNWAIGHRKQAIEWSRGFYKTTCFTIGTGIWIVLPVTDEDTEYATRVIGLSESEWYLRTSLHDQDATQLLAFEVDANAEKKIQAIKWHFEENELFRSVFPELAYDGTWRPWNTKQLRTPRVGDRRRDPEGTFEAIGVGGSLQSRHYKIVWEDDLVGEKARKSTVVMQDTIGWHGRLNGAFENATEQIRFLVSNRWGYADLNSYVRANEPDFVFHTRSAIELDPDTGEDAAVFGEEYPLDKLELIRTGSSMTKYDYACQYLNKPTLPGESEVDVKALHTYTVEPDGKMKCSCGKAFLSSQCFRYMHYDPYNAKAAGSTSCPAIVCVGCSTDGHVFLLDYYLGKENYGKVYDRLFFFNDTWRPKMFTFEDVGHQNLTAYHLREIEQTTEYKAKKHRPFPRIEGVATGNRTKEVRIREGLFPVIEKKKFSCRSKHVAFLQMLETFPHKTLDHDYDLLDALAQGSNLWRFPENAEENERAKETEDEYLRHFNEPYCAGVQAC